MNGTGSFNEKYSLSKRRLRELTGAVTAISACLEEKQVGQIAAEQAARLLKADACLVARWDPETFKVALWSFYDKTELDPVCGYGDPPEDGSDCPYIRLLLEQGDILQISQGVTDLSSADAAFLKENRLKSLLLLPLLVKGRIEGALAVIHTRRVKHYQDLEILQGQLIANQTSTSLENARLYQSVKRHSEQMETIYRASLHLTASLNLEEVLYAILESTLSLLEGANNAHIFLYENGELKFGAAQWADQRLQQPWAKLRPHGLTYTVARQGQLIVVEDMKSHPLYRDAPKDWEGAIVGLPLKIGARVVGVMTTAFPQCRQFSDSELRLLQLLGDQAAIAIENARLHNIIDQQAHTDSLTNLPNRRSFDERLEEEIRRSTRYRHHFALAMMDLNNFKIINDTYGHLHGDSVLKQVGACLRSTIRDTDFVARYGGDEFVFIMPETMRDTAVVLTERIRESLRLLPVALPGCNPCTLTACFGVAAFPEQGISASELLEQADQALYDDKHRTRLQSREG